jgi:hypothetical protein
MFIQIFRKKLKSSIQFVNIVSEKELTSFQLESSSKYQNQFFLCVLVLFFTLIINVVFIFLMQSLIHQVAIEEIFAIGLFGDSFIILLMSVILINAKNAFLLKKKFQKISIGNTSENLKSKCIITNGFIYLPLFCIEQFDEFITEENIQYYKISLDLIDEFIIEPSRGLRRITPPFYKIKLRNDTGPIFIFRSHFGLCEKAFINTIANYIKIQIIYNDKLN